MTAKVSAVLPPAIQGVGHAGANIRRQRLHIRGPRMAAVVARPRHHGQALHDEQTAIVVTLRAVKRERVIGVGHGCPVGSSLPQVRNPQTLQEAQERVTGIYHNARRDIRGAQEPPQENGPDREAWPTNRGKRC